MLGLTSFIKGITKRNCLLMHSFEIKGIERLKISFNATEGIENLNSLETFDKF